MTTPPSDPSNYPEVGKVSKDKISETGKSVPDSKTFEQYKTTAPAANQTSAPSEMSPMELATKAGISTTPTFQSLTEQAQNAKDTLGEVEKQLKTPKLQLKKSQKNLLDSKLNAANDHLLSAAKKLDAPIAEKQQASTSSDPLARYLGMVTDGQNQLEQVNKKLQELGSQRGSVSAGDMLLIQVKLSQAQQEIEYSSVLLSKVIDSIKQIINIQI